MSGFLIKFWRDISVGSPLHVAASSRRTQFLKELLHLMSPKLADVLDSQHQSALHIASAEGHVEIVRALTMVSPRICIELDEEKPSSHGSHEWQCGGHEGVDSSQPSSNSSDGGRRRDDRTLMCQAQSGQGTGATIEMWRSYGVCQCQG